MPARDLAAARRDISVYDPHRDAVSLKAGAFPNIFTGSATSSSCRKRNYGEGSNS